MQEKTAALYGEILMLTDQVCVCEKKLIIFFLSGKDTRENTTTKRLLT